MSKRNLLNLVLFVFVTALILFIVFEPGKQKQFLPLLTDLKADEISHITLKRSFDKQAIELVKKKQGWMMLSPYQLAANPFRIDAILKLLSTVSFSKNDLTNLNPAQFGFDQPGATITFNNSTTIVFGHNKSLNHHRYVKVGSSLYLIADTFYYQLTAKSESFIDHKVLPANINIVELHLPDFTLKKTNGAWQSIPAMNAFSADRANQLIDEWQLSQAYDIKVEKIKKTTKADITVTTQANKTFRFKSGKTKNTFSLTNIDNGVGYILSPDRKNKLLTLMSANETGNSDTGNEQ